MRWTSDCLTSGNIDLAGLATASLTFQSWRYFESSYDGGRIEVYSGSSWGTPATISPVYNSTADDGAACWSGSLQNWQEHTVSLTPYVGQTIRLRFCAYSDDALNYPGWYIDDLMILGN
jgi:bacillopeptidase F (M6 metalloprotease family)